jgi:hypothetical protein
MTALIRAKQLVHRDKQPHPGTGEGRARGCGDAGAAGDGVGAHLVGMEKAVGARC